MSLSVQQQIQQRGWSDPVALLTAREAAELAELGPVYRSLLLGPESPRKWRPNPDFVTRPWFKSLHAISPEFFDLAIHPTILDSVRAVLGNDILVWGVSVLKRRPGQVHRWHIDVEHIAWKGVSVFVGLAGVRPHQSSLKFISGSHRRCSGPDHDLTDSDDAVLALARGFDPECTLDYPAMVDGEFIMFDGPIWHGSHNTASDTRHASIIQYTVPTSKVSIPLTWEYPIMWADHRPPCILASGTDAYGLNILIDRPSHPSDEA
jgi:hypothetical protein